ncbi:MAG: ATP-binding protein [Clostridia bacterium]|nr:ATP-binding protein [Clostridia bacterium]
MADFISEIEVSLESWQAERAKYNLVDIRDEAAYVYGHVPGSVNIPEADIYKDPGVLPLNPLLVCRAGTSSLDLAEHLREQGVEAFSFTPGYAGWLREMLMTEENKAADVEASIRKKFTKKIWRRFAGAVKSYELVKPGDSIAVCISGGKDSMLMAKCFQELKRHNKFPFEVKYIVMDPGYSPANREIIENNLKLLNIPAEIFESQIFESVFTVEKNPCYLCARMRRGYLYEEAKKLGCNKIALGHHFDDVIETTLMSMLSGGQIQGMMPKLKSTSHPGMEIIRPLYLIREDDIKHWRDYNGLYFLQCACKFTETCTTCHTGEGPTGSRRMETKKLIQEIKKTNPQVEANIFHSMENVMLDTVIRYKKNGVVHSFLDDYDESED